MDLNRLSYWFEGLFLDHAKTEQVHQMRNEVTSVKLEIESSSRVLQKAVKNTTAYRVARATGSL